MKLTKRNIIEIESILEMTNKDFNLTSCYIKNDSKNKDKLELTIHVETYYYDVLASNVKNSDDDLRDLSERITTGLGNFCKVHYGLNVLKADYWSYDDITDDESGKIIICRDIKLEERTVNISISFMPKKGEEIKEISATLVYSRLLHEKSEGDYIREAKSVLGKRNWN